MLSVVRTHNRQPFKTQPFSNSARYDVEHHLLQLVTATSFRLFQLQTEKSQIILVEMMPQLSHGSAVDPGADSVTGWTDLGSKSASKLKKVMIHSDSGKRHLPDCK